MEFEEDLSSSPELFARRRRQAECRQARHQRVCCCLQNPVHRFDGRLDPVKPTPDIAPSWFVDQFTWALGYIYLSIWVQFLLPGGFNTAEALFSAFIVR